MTEKKEKQQSSYVERDLSWMYFNHRILQEAEKEEVPVLEQLMVYTKIKTVNCLVFSIISGIFAPKLYIVQKYNERICNF